MVIRNLFIKTTVALGSVIIVAFIVLSLKLLEDKKRFLFISELLDKSNVNTSVLYVQDRIRGNRESVFQKSLTTQKKQEISSTENATVVKPYAETVTKAVQPSGKKSDKVTKTS